MEKVIDYDKNEMKKALAEAEIKKDLAEAEKAMAETRQTLAEIETDKLVKDAESRKLNAEAWSAEVDAQLKVISLRIAESNACTQEIVAKEANELYAKKHADDYYHRVYWFKGRVSEKTVEQCMETLTEWHRLYPDEPIELMIDSIGGDVLEGVLLFDFIRWLVSEGHEVTCVAAGIAFSMGAILLQAGSKRVMYKESYLLIHQMSGAIIGSTGEIKDQHDWMDMCNQRIVNIFVERSGGKISEADFKKNWERHDWFLDSKQAEELGFVDEVR